MFGLTLQKIYIVRDDFRQSHQASILPLFGILPLISENVNFAKKNGFQTCPIQAVISIYSIYTLALFRFS